MRQLLIFNFPDFPSIIYIIKSDKGELNVTLFQLHEGAIVSVTGEDGGWVRVPLGPDKSGWTPEDTVGLIKKTGA